MNRIQYELRKLGEDPIGLTHAQLRSKLQTAVATTGSAVGGSGGTVGSHGGLINQAADGGAEDLDPADTLASLSMIPPPSHSHKSFDKFDVLHERHERHVAGLVARKRQAEEAQKAAGD